MTIREGFATALSLLGLVLAVIIGSAVRWPHRWPCYGSWTSSYGSSSGWTSGGFCRRLGPKTWGNSWRMTTASPPSRTGGRCTDRKGDGEHERV